MKKTPHENVKNLYLRGFLKFRCDCLLLFPKSSKGNTETDAKIYPLGFWNLAPKDNLFLDLDGIISIGATSVSKSGVWRHTCSLDEARVGVVRDEGDGQLSEIELQGSRDDVDVLVGACGDVGLLTI